MKNVIPLLIICCLLSSISLVYSKIRDPMNFFCGSYNCYDVLELNRTATLSDLKSSYRKISTKVHPDKNKAENATAAFRLVSKAYNVLKDDEKRELFDYYLDKPTLGVYYEVTGHFITLALPKANVALVMTIVILLLSVMFHYNQRSKYFRVIKMLRRSLLQLSEDEIRKSGSMQLIDLQKDVFARYQELYFKEKNITSPNITNSSSDNDLTKSNSNGNLSSKKKSKKEKKEKKDNRLPKGPKMLKEPSYIQAVDEILNDLEVDGGSRKPTWKDFFAVRLLLMPYNTYLWFTVYYRIEIMNGEPLNDEEKLELSIKNIGQGTWFNLSKDEQERLLNVKNVYKISNATAYFEELRELEIERLKAWKKRNNYASDDEIEYEDD